MKLFSLSIMFFLISQIAFGQRAFAKEWSKELALYKSKKYVVDSIIGYSKIPIKFEIDALAAASSGELTSLVYHCQSKNKEGMLLNFYGDYWNESGVSYQGFSFKNLPKEKALSLLDTVEKNIEEYEKYLYADKDNNNIYFNVDDIGFVITSGAYDVKLRVFWSGFEADWDVIAFRKTKRRLEKKIK